MDFRYYLPFLVLLLIILSMFIHGVIIMRELHGYRQNPKVKNHPEMKGVKKGDLLMVVRFTDEDYSELSERIQKQKLDELFEEPSTYEDELDDDT
ncbi:MAG: hypothetical protein ACO3CQ_00490 [Candidatus Nanopelagicaceae bacterium]|jgi:hypothetical protein